MFVHLTSCSCPLPKKVLCIRITYVQKYIIPGKQTALYCGVAANIRRKYELRSSE